MSLQVFLQAQVFGSEQFLGVHSTQSDSPDTHSSSDVLGRCAWLTLLCEVLPRALLAELKLSRMLLGSSSAEQFLLVLAEEEIPRANEFLNTAAAAISQFTAGALRLVWASTENLGAWPVARKRIDDALQARIAAPLANTDLTTAFAPFNSVAEASTAENYFIHLAKGIAAAKRVGWSAANPAQLLWDAGDHSWPLTERSADQSADEDSILFPRRAAVDDSGIPSTLVDLAARAEGAHRWGVLRGDVDHFDAHLRRANTIEEHIHLSVLFKQFFAGELALICSRPDFSRKVTILYRGGDDFAVAGAWDALVLLARELQRLFEKFIEQNAASFPGIESRSISMALSIAPDSATTLATVFLDAGAELRAAKSTDAGSFHFFGRTLEWKRLADAEELKTGLVRLVKDFRFPPDYINDLASVYREAFSARVNRRGKSVKVDKPWRTFMRLTTIIPEARSRSARGKELNNVRNAIITNLVGKRTAGLKLRPSARIGLEWARLTAGSQTQ